MLDCVHEWQLLQGPSKITNPPKVNIGCKYCKSQTWELETEWLAYEAKPTLHNRVSSLEETLTGLIKMLSKDTDQEEKKPKKVKK